jgi:hypothetical protein
MNRDCERSIKALGDDAALLTGWTGRVIEALAHLREAWCVADAGNEPAAVKAIGALLGALIERQSNAIPLAKRVLAHGLDPQLAEQLFAAAADAALHGPRESFVDAFRRWNDPL